ncbi:MAG: HIT domain-containing protein [Halobacteriaceae archaeon]
MDQVFAPWRIEWVEREDETGDGDDRCVFCDLPGQDADREHRIVARSDHTYVLLNNYPYNPGHCLVIPDPHGGDYTELADDVLCDHARLKQQTFRALEGAFDPDAFNAGLNLGGGPSGGSVTDHVHTHVVPRWEGDTNFMPVISDTKVIVEALDDTYDRLHTAFAELDGATRVGADAAIRL